MDQFAIAGYSGGNCMMCVIDNGDIFQTDYFGNRQQLIGKTSSAYAELEATTQEYYDKLVELGVITPPKTQGRKRSRRSAGRLTRWRACRARRAGSALILVSPTAYIRATGAQCRRRPCAGFSARPQRLCALTPIKYSAAHKTVHRPRKRAKRGTQPNSPG